MARAPTASKAAKTTFKSTAKSTQKRTAKSIQKAITKKTAKSMKEVIAGPSTSSTMRPSATNTIQSLGNDDEIDHRNVSDKAVDASTGTPMTTSSTQNALQEDTNQSVVQEDALSVVCEAASQSAQQVASSTSSNNPPAARTLPTCFLDLPPEIRNQIYTIALKQPLRLSIDKMRVPPLVQAHQQIRKEAMSMFLDINTFDLDIHVHNTFRGYRLSYCCSDTKLLELGLGSGYINNLKISMKEFGCRESTWKIALRGSGEVTCDGKYLVGRREDKAANVSRKIEQYISQWLDGKTQRRGLGLVEVWSLLSLFKMELLESVMG